MALPEPSVLVPEVAGTKEPPSKFLSSPGVSQGSVGDGALNPMSIPKSNASLVNEDGISTQEFGSHQHPFTTSRVDAKGSQTSRKYPFRAAGKLYFNIGAATYVCSASLIKKGVIVTAAHCVAPYGGQSFYSNWIFVPAKDDNYANNTPYGIYTVSSAIVLTSWSTGSSRCNVVCPDDVALLQADMDPATGKYPGQRTGWGYASTTPKVQGASPFTSSNIKVLIDAWCPGTAGC